ncbi:secreted RxLR effector protein 161-like [Vicia villosa]|uniref:secreted RxLR effector protein 161-like n=1 Tax=Vicia villosa TaxID=3911 RepID=UPI00273B41F5|nr:secreted RxLR effector protein 161-like [Vicia villosa]
MDDSNPVSSPVNPNVKLEKNGEEDKVDVTLFKQIVGSLRYMCNSRPDIGCKKNSKILKGSIEYEILFRRNSKGKEATITCFSDADWSGDKEDRRSTTEYLFQVFGTPMSQCSKKQPVVALSSCEAEYTTRFYAACQAI